MCIRDSRPGPTGKFNSGIHSRSLDPNAGFFRPAQMPAPSVTSYAVMQAAKFKRARAASYVHKRIAAYADWPEDQTIERPRGKREPGESPPASPSVEKRLTRSAFGTARAVLKPQTRSVMHARYENFDKWHYTKYVRQDPDGESLIYSKDYESRAPTVLDEWNKQVVEPLAESHQDGTITAKPGYFTMENFPLFARFQTENPEDSIDLIKNLSLIHI